MSNKNFEIESGLSLGGKQVLDANANATFASVIVNSIALTGGGSIIASDPLFGAIYNRSNTIFAEANASYLQANAASTTANAAFLQANTAYIVANTTNNSLQIVSNSVNAAFLQANNSNTVAQAAFSAANNKFSNSGGTISGDVSIHGSLSVTGNVIYTGNVTSIEVTGNTGQFFGYSSNGFNALYAGIPTGYVVEPETTFQVTSNFNGYSQINQQNISNANQATADYIVTSGDGNNTMFYIDMGYASGTYDGTNPNNSLGTSLYPNDGYLYVQGNTAGQPGGNLVIGTTVAGTVVNVLSGGINQSNIVTTFTGNGLIVQTNVASHSTNTGSLVVTGGAGIGGDVYVSGNVYAHGVLLGSGGGGSANVTGISITDGSNIQDGSANLASGTTYTVDTFSSLTYRTVKYLIQSTSSSDVHATEVLITNNGTNVYISEYGTTYSANLISVDAGLDTVNNIVSLFVTPTFVNSTYTNVDFIRTGLIARTIMTTNGPIGDLMSLSGSEDLSTETGSQDLNI